MTNHLKNSISPYLLQHQDNPVDWYPWDEEAFKQARSRNVPILISIGYAACHWCHVMAHESFEDPTIAKYLNEHFVAIKVDREERPDLDKIYMEALAHLQGRGGWPLNVFLTPDGKPFFGGTYFPPSAKYGTPSFIDVLQKISAAWHANPEDITQFSEQLTLALQPKITAAATQELKLSYHSIASIAKQYEQAIDKQQGGFQGAPKFPQTPLWRNLFAASVSLKDHTLLDANYLTASKLCLGGIYDHVGGGWMRYSTDAEWLVPHFEKMLYDNALLILWLSELAAYRPTALFEQRIHKTIAWLQRDMLTDSGAFAASLDADSEGVEGKYYVWDLVDIKNIVTTDLALFCKTYGVTETGNWEGKNILHGNHAEFDFAQEQQLTAALDALLQQRNQRIPPTRDDKILADWNGLLIVALCKASQVFKQDQWLTMATDTFHAITQQLYHDNNLFHCYRDGKYTQIALLEDYANMLAAALGLYQATHDPAFLSQAQQWCHEVNQHYWNEQHASYTQCSSLAPPLITNPIYGEDNALPAGNGIMAMNLVTLWLLTSEQQYFEKAQILLRSFAPKLSSNSGIFYSSLALAQGLLDEGLTIKLNPHNQELHDKLYSMLPPLSLVINTAEAADNIEVCMQQQCLPAIATSKALEDCLQLYQV